MIEPLAHEEAVELLIRRMFHADRLEPSRLHDFKGDLLTDVSDRLPDAFYSEAFEELEQYGFLHQASCLLNGGDACGRLSPDGRAWARSLQAQDADEPQAGAD
jgi:hypothetical protein